MIRKWFGAIFLIITIPIVFLLALFVSILAVLPIVVITLVIAGVLYLITKLGMHASPERSVEVVFSKAIGKESIENIRDDFLIAFYPGLLELNFDDLDRWSILRQIDKSRDRVIRRVAAGGLAISLVGGGVSIIIGLATNFGWALAIFLLLIAIVTSVSLVTIKILTFSSHNHEFDSLEDLAIMKGWNDGPMQEGTGIALILGVILLSSVFAKPGSPRYEKAMKRIQDHVCIKAGIDPQKWEFVGEEDDSDTVKDEYIKSVQ